MQLEECAISKVATHQRVSQKPVNSQQLLGPCQQLQFLSVQPPCMHLQELQCKQLSKRQAPAVNAVIMLSRERQALCYLPESLYSHRITAQAASAMGLNAWLPHLRHSRTRRSSTKSVAANRGAAMRMMNAYFQIAP